MWDGHAVDMPESDEWKITERSVEVAQSRAQMWTTFAARALERSRVAGPVPWGLATETWSCVVGINHVRSCALLATQTATVDSALTSAKAALSSFDSAVPRIKDARDFLEHNEAYVIGIGDLQQPDVRRSRRQIDEGAASAWNFHPHFIDGASDRPAVSIGPDIFVDLSQAVDAARLLTASLYRAAAAQGLTPTAVPTQRS